MENPPATKRKKSFLLSEVHPDACTPLLVNPHAQSKYMLLKHTLCPGMGISFNSFPVLLEKLVHIGWESLVVFDDRNIYPGLIAEFYSHLTFNKDESGFLVSITTCIQGTEYTIDELMLVNALHLKPSMLELPRLNEFAYPIECSMTSCMVFKHNLAVVTNQIIPALSFDFPVNVGLNFLTAQSQFLGKIIRKNFMPVRNDKSLCPFDLELIKCILHEFMPYNLAYFLLTSFEHCYNYNCMGYGLLLTSIFKFLNIDLLPHKSQMIPNSNIVSHLNLPPTPLLVFQTPNHAPLESHLTLLSQIETLTHMTRLILQNQDNMLLTIAEMQQTVYHLTEMVQFLLKSQKLSIPTYHFPASTSSAPNGSLEVFPQDTSLPPTKMEFSPLNLGDF